MANFVGRSRRITMKITESEIEKFAIKLLEKQGYQYIYTPSIARTVRHRKETRNEK